MSSEQILRAVTAPGAIAPDSHFYFRGRFELPSSGRVTLRLVAASWFEAWLDGVWLTEGPARFDPARPEYEERTVELEAGEHLLALHVHYEGVETRLMQADTPMFVFASAELSGKEVPVRWAYHSLDAAYRKTGRRIDCILGWVEWCRTDRLPEEWISLQSDEAGWSPAAPFNREGMNFSPLEIAPVRHMMQRPERIGEGRLVNMSVFTHDPTAAFISRQLGDSDFPPQGIWMRFDLGKVRLGRLVVTLSAPPGTVLQAAYSEFLHHGRVSPYISSSAGDTQSCNLDHFVLRGGRQTLKPLHPKGGRFIEVHLIGNPDLIREVDVLFEERGYYGESVEGAFTCSDGLLNRIWAVGVETLRSCSEDAITDNPTRERGQWLGDAVGAGMDILSVSYSDMRPLKRGLLQAAQCAGPDGMIPAVFPGTRAYLPSFAIQWVCAIPHYFELTGDAETLRALYPAAVGNLRCFDGDLCDDGLCMNPSRWNFIDWGYRGSSTGFRDETEHYTEMDTALSFFYLNALQAVARWAGLLGKDDEAEQWRQEESLFRRKMKSFLEGVNGEPADWVRIGYHAAALALESGLLEQPSRAACVQYLKEHILSCFPNCPDAPRLYDTTVEDTRLITPFFAHHVFPSLIEAGEMAFVLDQIRTCWGWMLGDELTTWLEVFDKRWSHCHQWSGCPTWILSRYGLGLHPRFDLGLDHYELRLEPGDLQHARGVIPVPYRDQKIHVRWARAGDGIDWELKTSTEIRLHLPEQEDSVRVESEFNKRLFCRRGSASECGATQ